MTMIHVVVPPLVKLETLKELVDGVEALATLRDGDEPPSTTLSAAFATEPRMDCVSAEEPPEIPEELEPEVLPEEPPPTKELDMIFPP